jgi:hypothetical protein
VVCGPMEFCRDIASVSVMDGMDGMELCIFSPMMGIERLDNFALSVCQSRHGKTESGRPRGL